MKGQRQQLTDSYIYTTVRMGIASSFAASDSVSVLVPQNLDAFHGLGTAGAATLRAVAPGISEALITTAAGLAAAIPAVIAYNLLGSSIREFAARGDDFALEMMNAVERSQPGVPEVRR